MDITDIRVRPVNDDSKLKAVASITIDGCFVVHDIRIIDNGSRRFVAMPSKKDVDGTHRDICHPCVTNVRKMISDMILDKYDEIISLESYTEDSTAE